MTGTTIANDATNAAVVSREKTRAIADGPDIRPPQSGNPGAQSYQVTGNRMTRCAAFQQEEGRRRQEGAEPATFRRDSFAADRGREKRLVSFPLPPNRTGGSPASGSPVEESPRKGLTGERMGVHQGKQPVLL